MDLIRSFPGDPWMQDLDNFCQFHSIYPFGNRKFPDAIMLGNVLRRNTYVYLSFGIGWLQFDFIFPTCLPLKIRSDHH